MNNHQDDSSSCNSIDGPHFVYCMSPEKQEQKITHVLCFVQRNIFTRSKALIRRWLQIEWANGICASPRIFSTVATPIVCFAIPAP